MNKLMNLPNYIQEIIDVLHNQGAEAFLVGGCVRDMLIQREVHDYDITTNFPPKKTMLIFQQAGYHVIPTGIQHGTITVIIAKESVEITTYRQEQGYHNHRTPEDVCFTSNLQEDLKRRDFTMNAIAYDPIQGIIDPFHGSQDIKEQIIRCVREPMERFEEDALRILRALRFCATLQFQLEEKTWKAIQQHAHDLSYISKERIRDEWNKLLMADKDDTLQFLRDAHVLDEIIPALSKLYDHPQKTDWHIYDIFTHTDVALNHTKGYPLTSKLAIVLHDIGKPQCESFDALGIAHYKGHAYVSMKMAEQILKNLHYDKQSIVKTMKLIQYHDYYVHPKRHILRKYLAKFDNDIAFALEALDVQIADNYGKNPARYQILNDNIEACKKLICEMETEKDFLSLKDLAVNGNDMIELGLHGVEIGNALHKLYHIALKNPDINTKDKLLEIIKKR